MVTDLFGSILQELSAALKIPLPGLHPDANNSCLLKLHGNIEVQLEIDREGKYLIAGSELGLVSPGRYRENLFLAALKANDLPYPRYGTFAYSRQSGQMVLFEMFDIKDLTGQKIADFLPQFLIKIRIWKEAIQRGEIPAVASTFVSGSHAPGLFGLHS